jgi:EmrB/QacA subfamily drug resistance transporter
LSSVDAVASRDAASDVTGSSYVALVVLLTAAFMELVDVSVVNIALPSVRRDLHANDAAIQWIVAAYSVAFAALLITGARLGDHIGRKRAFAGGMLVFTAASAWCAAAGSPASLIAARVLQGAGGGVMMPQILASIHVMFAGDRRVRAIAAYGAVAGVATVIGPLVGAALITADIARSGWRAIFLVNVAVGIGALIATAAVVPETRSASRERFDLLGVALLTAALVALFVAALEGRAEGWPLWSIASLALFPVALFAFLLHERRGMRMHAATLLDLGLFRHRSFVAGLCVSLGFFAAIYAFFLAATLFMQIGLGYSPLHAGLTGIPFSLGLVAGAAAAARFTPMLGRRLLSAGVLGMAAGMVVLLATAGHWGLALTSWELVPGLVVVGAAMGLVVVPLIDFVLAEVAPNEVAHASGLANMTQPIGGAIGVVLVGPLFFAVVASSGYIGALSVALSAVAAVLVITFGLSHLLPARLARDSRQSADEDEPRNTRGAYLEPPPGLRTR